MTNWNIKLKLSCNKEVEKISLCSILLKIVFPGVIEILAIETLSCKVIVRCI
jgi:hypothetical protein